MSESWHDVVTAGKEIERLQQAREHMVERVHRSGEFSDATRILKCGLCRERHVFHVEGSADPGIALLNMTEDSGWADFPNRHGQGRCVCPDCRQRMNER